MRKIVSKPHDSFVRYSDSGDLLPALSPQNKKYVFTGESRLLGCARRVFRIRSLATGTLGGWIEKESNLSYEGSCWIADHATVWNNATVQGNAVVCGHAGVQDQVRVEGGIVSDWAFVSGDVVITGGKVRDSAIVVEQVVIKDRAVVENFARIYGKAVLLEDARVSDNAAVGGQVNVYGEVTGYSVVCLLNAADAVLGRNIILRDVILVGSGDGLEMGGTIFGTYAERMRRRRYCGISIYANSHFNRQVFPHNAATLKFCLGFVGSPVNVELTIVGASPKIAAELRAELPPPWLTVVIKQFHPVTVGRDLRETFASAKQLGFHIPDDYKSKVYGCPASLYAQFDSQDCICWGGVFSEVAKMLPESIETSARTFLNNVWGSIYSDDPRGYRDDSGVRSVPYEDFMSGHASLGGFK
jgi:acyl-[acyl carrier protein]--UDP-N-acetylglucosamine O-acyltransferase